MKSKAPHINNRRDKIGILGGLFDPIHHGHISLCRHALEQLTLCKVLLIPTYNPPHREETSDYQHRLAMTKLAVEHEARLEASDLESHIRGQSYTLKTLKKLREEYAECALYFLIGSDNARKMADWHKPEEILTMAQVVMAERPDEKNTVPGKYEDRILRIDMPPMDVSSTQIRRAVRNGEPFKNYVPKDVYHYIKRNKLYVER